MYLPRLLLSRFRSSVIKWKFRDRIGEGSYVDGTVQVLGWRNVRIGRNCTVGERTLVTVNRRELGDIQFEIMDNCYIGRNNFFTVGKKMVIRQYCIFGNECSFLSSDHIFDDPLVPYASSGATGDAEIYIGVNTWLGHGVTVLGGVRVGHGCVVGARTLLNRDVPPFSLVVGNPGRIIKRFDFDRYQWVPAEEAGDIIFP
jgi:acetyltransferase-like isoleucine patch superfamily enzyme